MLKIKPPTPEEIVWEKRKTALALWAVKRVTPEQKEYADKLFYLFVFILMKATGCDYHTALKEAPYYIPQQRQAKNKNPFGPNVNLFRIIDEYAKALSSAKKILKKKWRNPAAMLLTFKQTFPGIPEENINKYRSMRAAEIAYDYLKWKYKLNVSGDAVKKYLGHLRPQLRTIKKLSQNLDGRQAEKRYFDIQPMKEKLNKVMSELK